MKTYTVKEVAEIIANATGELCACNINNNDEWLPSWCEKQDVCPYPDGVECWEQYVMHLEHKGEWKE